MNIRTKVGDRIRQLRHAKGISQEELGYLAGLDRTYITSVENGKRNISIINIEKICKALDVTVSKFFNNHNFS